MKRLLSLVLVACVAAGPMNDSLQDHKNLNCYEQNELFGSCLLVKTINYLNKAARSNDIGVIDGVTFVRTTPIQSRGRVLEKSEVEIMNELPSDTTSRALTLIDMLSNSAISFMKSHSLKLSMPNEGSISRALMEGRAKFKKIFFPLIASLGLKAVFFDLPILFGLSLLVLKTLVLSKLALLIPGVMAFQKWINKEEPQPSLYDYNISPFTPDNYKNELQGYRSFNNAENVDAHNLAYSAHAPDANN